jgi:hypothetical protein
MDQKLEIEPETELNTANNGPYILYCEAQEKVSEQ